MLRWVGHLLSLPGVGGVALFPILPLGHTELIRLATSHRPLPVPLFLAVAGSSLLPTAGLALGLFLGYWRSWIHESPS